MLSDDDGPKDGEPEGTAAAASDSVRPTSDSVRLIPARALGSADGAGALPSDSADPEPATPKAIFALGSPDPVMFLGLFSCCCGTVRFEREIL